MVTYGSTATERRVIARSAAVVAGTVAGLVALSLVLELPDAQRWVLAVVAVAAAVVAAGLLLRRERLPAVALAGAPALTAVLIGVAVGAGGRGAEAYAWRFALVVVHTCAFSPLARAAPTLAVCLVADVCGLLVADGRTPEPHWLIGPGTVLVGGLLVGGLVTAVRESAADALAVRALAEHGRPGAGDVATAACEAITGASDADVAIVLELLDRDAGLQVTGMVGASEAGMVFMADGIRQALQRCVADGTEQELHAPADDGGATLLGLAQPVLVDGRVVAVLAAAWTRPRRRMPRRLPASARLVAASAGVALDVAAQADRDRERMWLEVNDAIVQGLAVAKMAIQAGQSTAALAALDDTLARARDLIGQQLDRLTGRADEALQPGDLTRTSAATVADR